MSVTAKAVKELRDRTGAGMMDCKKALTECNGDMAAAKAESPAAAAAASASPLLARILI